MGRFRQGGPHALGHVDQRIDQHDGLQPVEPPDLDRGERRPGVVDTTEEGDRQDDEAEHEADVAGLELGAEEQAEGREGDAGQRDDREQRQPVDAQVDVHVLGMDDGRDREHDEGGQNTLDGA